MKSEVQIAYEAACEKELLAWQAVAGRGPGSPGYDAARWCDWLRCVAAAEAARTAVVEWLDRDLVLTGLRRCWDATPAARVAEERRSAPSESKPL